MRARSRIVRCSSRTRARSDTRRHDVAGSSRASSTGGAHSDPPLRHLVRIVVLAPRRPDPLRALEELKRELGDHELLGPAPLRAAEPPSRAAGRQDLEPARPRDANRGAASRRPRLRWRRAGLTLSSTSTRRVLNTRCVEIGRPAREDPVGVERRALIRPTVDLHEVASARIHRQACLGREVPVVPLDQLVDLREAPNARGLQPTALEVGCVDCLVRELPRRLVELRLMPVELVLDRAQPAHPDRRAAERAHRGVRVGPEVPQPPAEGLSLHGAHREVGLEDEPSSRSRQSLPGSRRGS